MAETVNTAPAKKQKRRYTKYTMGHLRFRNLRFWIFWLVLVALLVLALVRIHGYFDRCLKELESIQYSYVADEMAKIFTEKRFNDLFEYEHCEEEYLESREDYVAYLEKLAGDAEIEYTQIVSPNPREKRYLVTADGKSFAEFTLKETGEAYTYEIIPLIGYTDGDKIYAPGDIYIQYLNPVTYDYIVPDYATVSVNGSVLANTYIVGEPETLFFEEHLYKGAKGFKLVSYRFTCALDQPDIRVTDPEGNEVPLAEIGQDTYKYSFIFNDAELKPQFENGAVEFVKRWCLYSTHNTNRAKVLELVVGGSNAESFIRNYENTWITTADQTAFQDISTCNYAMIDGKVLTCEVSLTYHTVSKRKANDYHNRYRLYIVQSGNTWKIYDFELLSDSGDEN